MFRRALVIVAAAVLVAAQAGCRSQCGGRHGLFTSNTKSDAPCQTAGRNGGCYDAATGQPVPCPTGTPTNVIPGGAYPIGGPLVPGVGPRPDELHMPSPTDMIRPPAIPFPAPAPNDALLPLPTAPGTPVKGTPNK